jgi:hypothetical protein
VPPPGVLLRTLIGAMAGLVSALEVWWGLSLLGHPVSFGEALAIEADAPVRSSSSRRG